MSYARPRPVQVFVDGRLLSSMRVGTQWSGVTLDLDSPNEKKTITVSTRDCDSPARLGLSEDQRCLSFKIQASRLEQTALYDLSLDPKATRDLSEIEPDLHRQLYERLNSYKWEPVGRARKLDRLPGDLRKRLEALGYVR